MPKSSEVAFELRRLADALEKNPDAAIPQPWITFYAFTKDSFLNVARLFPRPWKKELDGFSNPNIVLKYETPGIVAKVKVQQSLTCKLIEPARAAVYDCDPILSTEEEAELEAHAALAKAQGEAVSDAS